MADSRYNSDAPQNGHETGDLLDRDGFAEAICDLVTTVPAPFTVGVYGSWGQGKTSFMKRVAVMLGEEKYQYQGDEDLGLLSDGETKHTAEKGNPRYIPVWFDLWAHQGDNNPVVSMLQGALRVLDVNDGRDPEFAQSSSAIQRWDFSQSLLSLSSTWHSRALEVLGANYPERLAQAFGVIGIALQGPLPTEVTGFLSGLVSFAQSNGIAIGKEVVSSRQKTKADKALKNQARLAAKFEKEEAQSQLQRRFREVLDMLSFDCDRIVFFIDDLDRCLPEVTVDLLEKIKIFLDHPKTVFVLGLDDEATRKAVAKVKSFDEYDPIRLAERERQPTSRADDNSAPDKVGDQTKGTMARDYLEKIIQFPFRVPPASSDSHEYFVRDAVKTNLPRLNDSKDGKGNERARVTRILADAASEKNASLRQVKRLVNAFTLNDRMGRSRKKTRDENGPTGNEEWRIPPDLYRPEVMAVVTAVQILWDREYADLCRGENIHTRGDWLKGLFVDFGEGGPQLGGLATSLLRKDAIALGENKTFNSELDLQEFDPKEHPYAAYVESAAGSAPVEAPDHSDLVFRWLKPGEGYLAALKKTQQVGRTWGDTVTYIRNNTGKTIAIAGDIWRILTVEDNGHRALLLSDQILALSRFHSQYKEVNWDTCDLNPRLQTEMRGRWGQELYAHVVAESPSRSVTRGESADGFFLLSVEEFKEHTLGVCTRIDSDESWWWWLRSVGASRVAAPIVRSGGTLRRNVYSVHNADHGVRPALWINLES